MNIVEHIKKYQIDKVREEAIVLMKSLGKDLLEESKRLEEDPERKLWGTGFIQGRGLDIDRRCAEWYGRQSLFRELNNNVSFEEK